MATICQYNTATYHALFSTDEGMSWATSTTTFERPTAITAGASLFVVMSSGTGITTKAYRSADGDTWTESTDIFSDDQEYNDIDFDGTRFIALANDGYVNTSLDAITWNEVGLAPSGMSQLKHISSNEGTVIATGLPTTPGNPRIVRSIDSGQTWTAIATADDANEWRDVVFGLNKWVTIPSHSGTPTNKMAYSDDDGVTWTIAPMPLKQYTSLSYGGNHFIATYVDASSNKRIMVSKDGSHWFQSPLGIVGDTEALSAPFIGADGFLFIGYHDTMLRSGI